MRRTVCTLNTPMVFDVWTDEECWRMNRLGITHLVKGVYRGLMRVMTWVYAATEYGLIKEMTLGKGTTPDEEG